MNSEDIELIRDALVFFIWAAGEGLSPIEVGIPEPEESLFQYAIKTGNEDYDSYPVRLTDRIESTMRNE